MANQPVGANGLPSVLPCRPTRAYIKIMGAAEGVIIPIIITAHIANTYANSIALWCGCRHHDANTGRDHAKPGHVHAAHVHVVSEPEHIAPCQRDNDPERTGNDKTIAPQQRFQSAVGHLLGVVGRSPDLPADRFAECITLDLTSGSRRNGHSCRNHPNACRDR